MLSRRRFVQAAAAVAAVSGSAMFAEEPGARALASDPLRPACHLLPPGNWMNDPNGPVVWKDRVHVFYQVNPHGADWGDISWGHAVSTDMVHWKHLPIVMEPQAGAPDSYGVFSGSSVVDGDRVMAFYTAVKQVPDAKTSTLHGDKELREQQTVAVASDDMLLHWTRQTQPLITTAPVQPTAGFRDPSAWRDGDTWFMTVGSGVMDKFGCVLLYRATVPTGPKADWRYVHPLISEPGNGKQTADTVEAGTMWECPDFFALDGHHMLLYSTERKVYWVTGQFNRETLLFEPGERGMLDTGAYYAPKSMVVSAGERILWGWIPERRPKEQYIAAGWSGCMALPRVLHVDSRGRLQQTVVPAVDKQLLTGRIETNTAGAHVPGLAAKLAAHLLADGSGVTVRCGEAKLLELRRRGAQKLEVNAEVIDAPMDEPVMAYVDGSVMEVFVGAGTAHTVRAYPALREAAGLTATASGSATLGLQQMRPISANRLTT